MSRDTDGQQNYRSLSSSTIKFMRVLTSLVSRLHCSLGTSAMAELMCYLTVPRSWTACHPHVRTRADSLCVNDFNS